MCLSILINFLYIFMQLHISAIIVDNKLIYIRNNFLYLIHGQQKSIRRKKNKTLRKLFPAIFMKLYNSCVQKRLIVSIKSQMPFISPIVKLVNDTVKKIIFHSFVRPFFRIFVCRTKRTGAVTAVYGFQVYYQRLRNFFSLQKVLNIFFL